MAKQHHQLHDGSFMPENPTDIGLAAQHRKTSQSNQPYVKPAHNLAIAESYEAKRGVNPVTVAVTQEAGSSLL